MKVIIFGATGNTGIQVVTQALGQGHEVTAFVRDPAKFNQHHENLQVIKGDVLDYDTVERSVKGHDAVLCSIGLPPFDKSNLRAKGTRNIIRAMENTGVKRLICQSSDGVGEGRKTLPFLYKYLLVPFILRRVFADHEIQEQYIKQSRLDWTIVRPTALTNGVQRDEYFHGSIPDSTQPVTFKISRADTAGFMLKQLTDNFYLRKTPSLSY